MINTEQANYERALKLYDELGGKYKLQFIIEFMAEWEKITELIKRYG
jgi:hypothetical protein